jgi:hypothetical protein
VLAARLQGSDDARQVGDLITEHLADDAAAMPVVRARFSAGDQADLQIALVPPSSAWSGTSADCCGLSDMRQRAGR